MEFPWKLGVSSELGFPWKLGVSSETWSFLRILELPSETEVFFDETVVSIKPTLIFKSFLLERVSYKLVQR